MSAKDGKPCKKCGSNEWYKSGDCAPCVRKSSLNWKRNNRERERERYAKWQRDNPDKIRERDKRWRHAHPAQEKAKKHRRHTRKTGAGGSFAAAEWQALIDHYGNRCLCCGRTDVKLTADHIIPISKGGTSDIDNIQPLCGRCNSGKSDRIIDYRPDAGLGRWIQRKLFG